MGKKNILRFKTIQDMFNKDKSVFRKPESNQYANGSDVLKNNDSVTTGQKDSVKIGYSFCLYVKNLSKHL